MAGELFAGNLLVGFIISVIIIASYSNLEENQHMFLVYLLTYGLAFFKIASIHISIVMFLAASFIFIEYLTVDKMKLELVTSFWNKLIDFLYLIIIQFRAYLFAISMFFLFHSHVSNGPVSTLLLVLSVGCIVLCEHLVITQPFKTKNITGLSAPFNKYPFYSYNWSEEVVKRYQLLCLFEDKSYLHRKKSYSILSSEYLSQTHAFKKIFGLICKTIRRRKRSKTTLKSIRAAFYRRGFSTPEMQLIRTIGVVRGYDKHKITRKIYEIVYSHIFFSSLKQYQIDNSGPDLEHYREYILDIYLKSVLTKINGHRFTTLNSIFENPDSVESWPLEGLFVACLGLSFRPVDFDNIALYHDVIDLFDLDISKIFEYAKIVEQRKKIPCFLTDETKELRLHDQL